MRAPDGKAARRDAKAHKKATRPTRVGTDAERTLSFQCDMCVHKNGDCASDTRGWHTATAFAPNAFHAKTQAAFHGALEARRLAVLAGRGEDDSEVRDNAARMRTHAALQCQKCRDTGARWKVNPTSLYAQCAAEWELMKAAPDAECVQCHTDRALEANHMPSFSERAKAHAVMVKTHGRDVADAHHPPQTRKLGQLSQPHHWTSERKGGIEAMRRELQKCEWLCACCHALDTSSPSAPDNAADPTTVKREDYTTQHKFAVARYSAGSRQEKRAYVNALKRDTGGCERRDCPHDGPNGGACDEGFEACFDWDHQDEVQKTASVSQLVNNAKSFATAKPLIDVEVRKCRLLCCNCHKTKKEWLPRESAEGRDPFRPRANAPAEAAARA